MWKWDPNKRPSADLLDAEQMIHEIPLPMTPRPEHPAKTCWFEPCEELVVRGKYCVRHKEPYFRLKDTK